MSSIRSLRTFLAVARLGSFAAAGKEVGLTAAAVGLQVRALEDELEQQLFDRGARAVVLNPAGRRLVDPVQEIVERYEALAAPAPGGRIAGTVVMGALVSALMGAFADALWAIRRENPDLDVRLFAGQSADFANRLERGELDAAVATQPPSPLRSGLRWTPLYSEPMVLVVPRKPHFELPEDGIEILARCPFMRFDRQTWTGHLVDEVLARAGASVSEGIELNSVEAIVALVRQGFGVSVVPRLANLQWSRDRALRIVPLPGDAVQRHVGLLERRRHGRERFTEAVKDYFGRSGGLHGA
ncbi:MAG: LysR family transcriptional regulator [Burkholderiales bacterium]|nr:LysR family transcriptional regulator [Burkholderiales bacterium]MDE1927692.1 LysR family transcriptional regulator [Burkholderiales bacterium]MDE2157997.1 LysR family transcriptional regulator [Burkholderiales bacterium]MDE2502105.1 LysR family transcriptional regulator [Burkholderiales bacterium]